MSGVLFYLPNARQLSLGGAILPGWKAKFFVTGTLTPAAVYANAALSVPLGTVVAADLDGHMKPIYLDQAVIYRAQIYDADGILQPDGDIDPVNIQGPAVLSIVAGTNVSVDSSDPRHPIVSAAGGGGGGGGGSLAIAYATIGDDGTIIRGAHVTGVSHTPNSGLYIVSLDGSWPLATSVPIGTIDVAPDPYTICTTMQGDNTVNVQIKLAADGSFFDASFGVLVIGPAV